MSGEPDFRLDRTARVPLVNQLVVRLKRLVSQGAFGPGDVLPGIHELARAAAVSEKVPRRALALLARDGWVVPRRGVGSVVCARDIERDFRGRVLLSVRDTDFGYYSSHLSLSLIERLRKAGFQTLLRHASSNERADCRTLEVLLRSRWDLIVEFGQSAASRRLIETSQQPFLVLGDGGVVSRSSSPTCVGHIDILTGKAVPDLLRAIVASRTKAVVQFIYGTGSFSIAEQLTAIGLRVTTVTIARQRTAEAVSRCALRQMNVLLDRERPEPQTLFLFTDDYLAQGAFLSILAHGLRVPQDIRVISHANRGLGPVWLTPVTRLEMDPEAHARALADVVIGYFGGKGIPKSLVFGSEWRTGKTF